MPMLRIAVPARVPSLIALVVWICLGISASFAAGPNSASLTVTVVDSSHAYVPKASIVLRNVDTGVKQDASTGTGGASTFPFLSPGHYDLLVQKQGFANVAVDKLILNVGDNKNIELVLQIGAQSETVSVNGDQSNINTTDASVSTVIDRQFVENIPLNGRSFQSLMTIIPGTLVVPSLLGSGGSGELSVNGQRTESNYYTVDGVSAASGVAGNQGAVSAGYSGSLAAETALGTTQSIISVDALQEFRATTSTYSAEYGRTPGGQFSFISRGGTNDWHGSAFDYFRNEALDANNWFNNHSVPPLRKAAERQNDFGGTLGGPVRIPHAYNGKDHTFFFFSYEGLRLQAPQTGLSNQVPSLSLRHNAPSSLQAILNAFPIPNGRDLGNGLSAYSASYSNPSSLDSTSVRIDHSFTDRLKLFGRYSYAPSNATSRYTGNLAQLNAQDDHLFGVTLGLTDVISQRSTNDLRANFSRSSGTARYYLDTFGGASPFSLNDYSLPSFSELQVCLCFGGSPLVYPQQQASKLTQWNITDSQTFLVRSHSIKLGIDFRRLSTRARPLALTEVYQYSSQQSVLSNTADSSSVTASPISTEPIYNQLSAFAQDDWSVTRRLSVSFGARWELVPAPSDGYGNIPYTLDQIANLTTAVVAPKGTPLWKTTYANFAPRLGVAYRALEDQGRETVLRGGIGVFYDLGSAEGSAGLQGLGYTSSASYTKTPFPFTDAQVNLPAPSVSAPYNSTVYAFAPDLKLPYAVEWNIAVEQAFGSSQSLTLDYVGSTGNRLLLQSYAFPGLLGNHNFTSSGPLKITQNSTSSAYNSLQVKFQRNLTNGLQLLSSYTWSHALDNASSNFLSYAPLIRGNSNFDIRNNFQVAATYSLPNIRNNKVAESILGHWAASVRLSARSALPVDITTGTFQITGTAAYQQPRADLVPNIPVYVDNPTAPGKRVINFAAFSAPTAAEQAAGQFGNSPRNFLRAFDSVQGDVGIERTFPIYERFNIKFRAEAFNITNHPNFGAIYTQLSRGISQFGYAYNTLNSQLGGLNPLYQIGGPRSLQTSLHISF